MPLKIGTRDAVIAAKDIQEEIMDVPEWGCALKIRGLSLRQRHNALSLAMKDGEIDSLRLTVMSFIEGVVEPKFTFGDYETLLGKSAVVERVALRIHALSGIGQDKLEQAIKN